PIANATALDRKPVPVPIVVKPALNKQGLLAAIRDDFGARINHTATDKAPDITEKFTINKYLPDTYRKAFNFTSPRVPNAKTDDSYHCAIREKVDLKVWENDERISWGQLFAHILRQPMLAKACGMIYSAEVTVTGALEELFAKGCYIYADVVHDNYTKIQDNLSLDTEGPFIKPYAARLPKLLPGVANKRPVFAPILFPVLFRLTAIDPEPPKAPWDKIFAELNEYTDGFARIVHAQQPVSTDLLKEAPDGSHPVKDEGIRLAWDDEQILIWYARQLEGYKENPADPGPGVRVDAPLGVYGYGVDVKEDAAGAKWKSLNTVSCKNAYDIGGVALGNAAGDKIELPFQVFPTQIHNDTTSPYWLPMYYTGWTGKSLVLKDIDAISIHQLDQNTEMNGAVPKKVAADNRFDDVAPGISLQYGHRYHFRVRMMDISGGGPAAGEDIPDETPSSTTKWSFKRYIAPGLCRIEKPESLGTTKTEFFNEVINDDDTHSFEEKPVLHIKRPTLNYPAVVFTNKYQAAGQDPVALLIQSVQQQKLAGTPAKRVQIHPAIADPDVSILAVKVEVETLRLDNLASETGKENYVTLYDTTRKFPNAFEGELPLGIDFRDVAVLNLGSNDDPFNDPALTKADIDAMETIPLPTARKIRITVRGVCGDQVPSNESYYGFINDEDVEMDSRYGKTSRFWFYKESTKEDEVPLLVPKGTIPEVQGLYLQPDPEYIRKGQAGQYFFFSAETSQQPDIMQRLAQQLGLRVKDNGLTLVGEKGERVVFGCSNKIRHHLAPDGSSITFSTKADLCQHWIACIAQTLNRDWTWDALEDVSFTVSRNKKFKKDTEAEREIRKNIGDIEIKHSASFESLMPDAFGNVNRQGTTLIFIDAIEPKPER
ncbi:MAG TPA: hypothetical protein VK644_05415, partial [Chitinophagaceae bacterium]|nr:hypothetical protein [Chitinophagaceae bacterium]